MDITKIIEKNRNAIVLIDLQKPAESGQMQVSIRGTGFIISKDGKFITNAHVYNQIPQNELEHIGVSVPKETDERNLTHYKRYQTKLLKIDEENDVALMQIVSDEKDFETIEKVGDAEKVQEGDEVVYIGYPLATEMLTMGFGITMTTNKCIISSIKRRMTDGSLHLFLVDTHTNNGSSGSPVFSTETGQVVGIVSGKISSRVPAPNGQLLDIPANIGICRPAKYIDNILK
jgi:S1-C subfamily serine protease